LFKSIALCAQVIVTPEDNSIIVFTRGKLQGSNVRINFGGHIFPTSTEGAKLQCKNAQKNEKKNMISETINSIIPNLIPFWTLNV
jgi:hypothetical protein